MDRNYQTISSRREGSVAHVTLNRPERRNALGPQMINELLYAFDDAFEDEGIRCVVLTGAGDVFCAGGDFSQMGGADADALPVRGDFKDLMLALFRATKPVIARVNGHAMGGGLGLVAASTFAVATIDAKLGTPEVDVGLFPFMIYAVLERLVPRRALLEMMLCGSRLSATEAAALGLLNKVVSREELDDAVEGYVTRMLSKSPMTLRLGLEAVRDVEGLTMEAKLPLLGERLLGCLATEDAREGLMAFVQKRKPEWTGK